MSTIVPQKRCNACEQEYPATTEFFNADKSKPYGVRNVCKICRNNARRKTHRVPAQPGYQRCTKCEQEYPATKEYFYANSIVKDGMRSECKVCVRKGHKEYYSRPEIIARGKAARRTDEYRVKANETAKRYNRTHLAEKRAYEYRRRRTDIGRAYYRAKRYRRQFNQTANGGNHTPQDILNQHNRQSGKCYYCQRKVGQKYQVDHIVPLTRGGSNDPSNLVIACHSCNASKSNKLLHEWNKGGRLL